MSSPRFNLGLLSIFEQAEPPSPEEESSDLNSDQFSSDDVLLSLTPSSSPGFEEFELDEEDYSMDARGLDEWPLDDSQRVPYNLAQKAVQKGLRFIGGAAPVVATVGLLNEYDCLPEITTPYAQVLTSAVMIAAPLGYGAIRHVLNSHSPLDYLREMGGSHAPTGLGREVRASIVAIVPPVMCALTYSSIMQQKCQQAEADMDINKMILCYTLDAPINKLLLVGVPAHIIYGVSKKLMECCSPVPEKKVDEHPDLHFMQKAISYALRAGDAILLSEALRQCILMLRPEFMHAPMAALLPVMLDQLFLSPLHYTAWQVHPLKNIAPDSCYVNVRNDEEADLLDNESGRRSRPNHTRKKALAFYAATTAGVFGIACLANQLLLNQVTTEGDPENVSTQKRAGYEALLMLGTMAMGEAIKRAPEAYSAVSTRLSSWWRHGGGLFSQDREQMVELLNDDYESGWGLSQL